MGQRFIANRYMTRKTMSMKNTHIEVGKQYGCPFAPTKRVEVVSINGGAAACKIIENSNQALHPNHVRYVGSVMLVPLMVLENANPL
jgi:hypothetical protein